MRKTTLFIVDDQRIFAEGLKFVIESRTDDFEVIGIADNGRDALTGIAAHVPDIVLMDVRMPVMDGVEATKKIHAKYPQTKILILTTFDDDEYVRFSMENGAVGYLLKNRPPEELIDSIRALDRGILQIDPAVSGKLFHTKGSDPGAEEFSKKLSTLTLRECEVLQHLVDAKKIVSIAADLEIAEQTVRNHISNIYFKLGIHDKLEIIRYIQQIRRFLADRHSSAE